MKDKTNKPDNVHRFEGVSGALPVASAAMANKKEIKVGDVVIFRVDEFRNGDICEFDGHVQLVNKTGVDVLYLSGYRSRNDFILYKDIIAKVDKSMPEISLKDAPFTGHFIEYGSA